jgi:hypothetical protein
VQRAEGNPLFLEQLLRNVREHGDGDVPASIQSLVLARIDRLPPADKQAVQAASVLGQPPVFPRHHLCEGAENVHSYHAPQVHHARGHDLSATRPGCQKVIVAMIETL